MRQGIRTTRREDARLAHATAKELSEAPGFCNVGFGTNEHRTDGRAEAFAEAQADGVEGGQELFERCLRLCCDVPNPGAIEVQLEAEGMHVFGDGDDFFLGEDSSIEGILKRDNFSGGTVKIRFRHSCFCERC